MTHISMIELGLPVLWDGCRGLRRWGSGLLAMDRMVMVRALVVVREYSVDSTLFIAFLRRVSWSRCCRSALMLFFAK